MHILLLTSRHDESARAVASRGSRESVKLLRCSAGTVDALERLHGLWCEMSTRAELLLRWRRAPDAARPVAAVFPRPVSRLAPPPKRKQSMSQASQQSQADDGYANRTLPQPVEALMVRRSPLALFGHPQRHDHASRSQAD